MHPGRCETPYPNTHAPVRVCGSTAAQTHAMTNKRKIDEVEGCGSDVEDYKFMDEDDRHTMTAPLPKQDTNHPSDARLRGHKVIPAKLAHLEKNEKKRIRIRHMETTLAKARTFFGRFQRWYVRHQLSKASGTTGPDLADYKRRLFADPLGLVPVDHTDTRCWTTKKMNGKTTHLETEFYRGLKLLH